MRVHKIKAGRVVLPNLVNFSFTPHKLKVAIREFNLRGWETADLVWFESEDAALNCGRPI